MQPSFQFKTLAVAISSLTVASLAGAAGLDRTGQDTSAFFQDGTYAEISYTYIDADVTGYDNSAPTGSAPSTTYTQGNEISDIADPYSFVSFGVKTDVNDVLSIGVLFDHPFGAAATYQGNNNFVGNVFTPRNQADNQTDVEVRSSNITGLVGYKLGENFQLYGGPALQSIDADLKLRGTAYGGSTGYDAHMSPENAVGWVAGGAFMKPEIGLKAALTYRSAIDHTNPMDEMLPILASPVPLTPAQKKFVNTTADANGRGEINVTTPESFNFDFQTGLNKTTLATAKVRYVPWSDFEIVPPLYNALTQLSTGDGSGLPLVGYSDDQWLVELGMAKRLTPALAVSGSVGWDSGAGNPVTSLGPIEGYYSVGAGAKYNFTPNWAISAGGKYLKLGDAMGMIPTGQVVSQFDDNDGYVLGVKLSYQDK